MKKVIFVLDRLDMGGLQNVNVTLANELSENSSYQVFIYSLQKKASFYKVSHRVTLSYGENNLDKYFVFSLKVINFIIKKITKKDSNIVRNYQMFKLKKFMKKNSINTVILNGPALLFANKFDSKIYNTLMWMHNNSEKYLNDYFSISRKLLINCMKSANRVVTLTNSDQKDYSKFSNNVIKIYNPLTLDNIKPSNLDKNIILMVGRIDIRHKGLDYLIEISKQIPKNWEINLVGDGSPQDIKWLENQIEKNNLKDVIKLLGKKSKEQLREIYSNASLYLMTSRWEGFGLVLTEAMSAGLPIIAFEQKGSIEILNNGEFGILINKKDTQTMAKYVNLLIDNYSLRKEYQKKSLKRIKDFEIKNIMDIWDEIL